MILQRLREIDANTLVMLCTYVVLALILVETIVNRVLFFLTRYQNWSELFASETLAHIGRLSFIFSDIGLIFLILLISIVFLLKSRTEPYIALLITPFLAADILRYILRTTFETFLLTALLNISSLAIILTMVSKKLKQTDSEQNFEKGLIYGYLGLLTTILALQHMQQLSILVSASQALGGAIIPEATLYLMLINAFLISAYAFTTSNKDMRRILLKPKGIISTLVLAGVVFGLLQVNMFVPQALPDLLTLILGFTPNSTILPLILVEQTLFLFSCILLILNSRRSKVHQHETVGLLLIFTSTFLLGSVYYYPRVVIGIILVSTAMLRIKQSTLL